MERVSSEDQSVVDRLRAEHATLDARLHELEHHVSLTANEQFEIARLKKMKLLTKDRIAMITAHRNGNA